MKFKKVVLHEDINRDVLGGLSKRGKIGTLELLKKLIFSGESGDIYEQAFVKT